MWYALQLCANREWGVPFVGCRRDKKWWLLLVYLWIRFLRIAECKLLCIPQQLFCLPCQNSALAEHRLSFRGHISSTAFLGQLGDWDLLSVLANQYKHFQSEEVDTKWVAKFSLHRQNESTPQPPCKGQQSRGKHVPHYGSRFPVMDPGEWVTAKGRAGWLSWFD